RRPCCWFWGCCWEASPPLAGAEEAAGAGAAGAAGAAAGSAGAGALLDSLPAGGAVSAALAARGLRTRLVAVSPASLPGESGVLSDKLRFSRGCEQIGRAHV